MTVETIKQDGYTARLMADEDPQNPRKKFEFDNLAVFVCEHRRYDLGDISLRKLTGHRPKDFASTEQLEDYIRERFDAVAFEWLSLLDHSGLYLYTGTGHHPAAPQGGDSGLIGFAFVARDAMVEEFGADTQETRERARAAMLSEIKTYGSYLSGDVYGYVIEDATSATVDACYGFYGYEDARRAMQEALDEQAGGRA